MLWDNRNYDRYYHDTLVKIEEEDFQGCQSDLQTVKVRSWVLI